MVKQALTFSIAAALCLAAGQQATLAQGSNDFFGGAAGGQSDPNRNNIPGAQAAQQALGTSPADYTADEKRMQKKHKSNLVLAQRLIDKGDRMLKDGEKRKHDPSVKKGKILKEIGEKRLAQLKENNPLPESKM